MPVPFLLIEAALFVGSLLARELLAARVRRAKTRDLETPSAEEGRYLPTIYGQGAVSPTVINFGDAESITSGSNPPVTRYYKREILALCHGVVHELVDLSIGGKSLRLAPVTRTSSAGGELDYITSPALPISRPADGAGVEFYVSARDLHGGQLQEGGFEGLCKIYWGEPRQPVDPLTTHFVGAEKASGRPHMSYLCLGRAPEGAPYPFPQANGKVYVSANTPVPQGITALVRCIPHALLGSVEASSVGLDANPAEILYDILTNTPRGLEMSGGRIDLTRFTAEAERYKAEGLGLSCTLDNPSEADDLIAEIEKHIDAAVFRDPNTGLYTIVSARGDYDPATLPVIDASTAAEFEVVKDESPELYNDVRLTYRQFELGPKDVPQTEELTASLRWPRYELFAGAGTIGNFLYYWLKGRKLIDLVVTNTTKGVVLLEGTDFKARLDIGMVTVYDTPNVDEGDRLVASYTPRPDFVGFRESVAQAQDLAGQQLANQVRSLKVDYPFFTNELSAARGAARVLRTVAVPIDRVRFRWKRTDQLPYPMLVVLPNYPDHGYPGTVAFRLLSVNFGDITEQGILCEAARDVWSDDVIPQIPDQGTGANPESGGATRRAPSMAIACVSPGAFRVGLFGDPFCTMRLWVSETDLGPGVTAGATLLSDTLPGTTASFDYLDAGDPWPDGTVRFFAAQLIREGYEDGPITAWRSCTAQSGAPGTPECTIPSYTVTPDTGAGSVTLTITDPQGRLQEVAFRTRSGNGPWSDYVPDPAAPFTATVVLSELADSRIEWRLAYLGCDGETATLEQGYDFRVNSGGTAIAVVVVTPNLATGASAEVQVNIGKTFLVLAGQTDQAARVRGYNTAARRTADAGRPELTLPGSPEACALQFTNPAGDLLSEPANPWPVSNRDTPRTAACYLAVRNDGAAGPVTVTLTVLILEP